MCVIPMKMYSSYTIVMSYVEVETYPGLEDDSNEEELEDHADHLQWKD